MGSHASRPQAADDRKPPDEIRKADAGARRSALIVITAILLCGVLALTFWDGSSARFADWLVSDPHAAPERAYAVFAVIAAAIAIPLVLLAAWTWRLAAKALAAREFPPPGVSVIRDTPVVRGVAAERRASALRAFGIACVIASVAACWLAWRAARVLAGVAA